MTTANKNFLSPTGFQFKIDSTQYSNVEYFCTAVTLPDLTLGEAPNPYKGSNLAMTGDRIGFGDLAIRFNVTEDMENYIEMYKEQLQERWQYKYPPYYRLIKITLKHRDYNKVDAGVNWLFKALYNFFLRKQSFLNVEFVHLLR